MSEKRIVGIDVGTYSVKVVHLDAKAMELSVEGYEQELVVPLQAAEPAPDAPAAAPPPIPGQEGFEDAPTGVHEAPPADADETTEKKEGESTQEGAGSIEFDVAPDWVRTLARLRERDALSGLQSTTVPGSQAMLIELEVPFEDKSKVTNILPHLMMDRLPLGQDEIVWDFETAPNPTGEGARALVAFARNDDVEELLKNLESAGVDPATLGVAELQLGAIGARLVGEETGTVAFVDLGHETSKVAVNVAGRTVLGRTIRSGGRQITDAIQQGFGGTFAEAENLKHQYAAIIEDGGANPDMTKLSDGIKQGMRAVVRDLRRTFQGLFAKKRTVVEKVYICGGTSQIKNLEAYLSAELGIPVRRLRSNIPGLIDKHSASVGLGALAAAVYQQSETLRTKGVNLRTGRFTYRGRSSYLRRQLFLAAAGVFALMMVLGLSLYMQKLSYEAQRDAMRTALKKQTKSLLGDELTSKKEIQAVMDGGDTGGNSFIPNKSAYHLLHEVTLNLPKDVEIKLDRIEVDTDRNLIQIYGETTDAQAVDRIVSDLETGIDCLKEIKKDKLKVRDEKADFELQISSGCT